MSNKLRASGQIQDKDRYISISETKRRMMAILTEIQLEIEELDTPSNGDAYMTCSDIIQQKINSLKEDSP